MGFVWNKSTQLRRAERQDAPDQQRVLPGPLYPLRLPSPLQWLGLAKWRKKLEVLTVHNLRWRSASGGRPGATSPCSSPCSSPTFSLSPPSPRSSPWLDFPISLWLLPSSVLSFLWTMDRPAHQVNLFLLLRFFPNPTIDLIFAIKGHVIQVLLFQPGTLWYPIWPNFATSWYSWIIDNILYSKRIVMPSICNPSSASTSLHI